MIGEANDKPSPIGERAEPPATLGQVLKSARSARDLTLEQVSTELRIEAQQLLALEQDQFERIGAPVFAKGYLRHYGQRLGLDYADLLVLYYKQVDRHEVVVQPSRSIKLRDERQITVWIIAGVVIAVLIVMAFWWFRGSGGLAAVSWLAGLELASEAPAVAVETRTAALDTSGAFGRRTAARDSSGSSGETNAALDAAVPSAESAGVAAASAESTNAALALELRFDQESWAEVTDARGERLFFGLGRAGRSVVLSGQAPIQVLLGNAGGVRLAVDGTDYALDERQGQVARLTLPAPEN